MVRGRGSAADSLCCCEYTNEEGETSHIVACCCDCEALDTVCDRYIPHCDRYTPHCDRYIWHCDRYTPHCDCDTVWYHQPISPLTRLYHQTISPEYISQGYTTRLYHQNISQGYISPEYTTILYHRTISPDHITRLNQQHHQYPQAMLAQVKFLVVIYAKICGLLLTYSESIATPCLIVQKV